MHISLRFACAAKPNELVSDLCTFDMSQIGRAAYLALLHVAQKMRASLVSQFDCLKSRSSHTHEIVLSIRSASPVGRVY